MKISLDDSNISFVSNFRDYGYSSKSAMVNDALRRLHQESSNKALLESAKFYRQVYEDDWELQELIDSAASSCLEQNSEYGN